MESAYIYDAVRTPRGKGREGGALNHLTPLELQKALVAAIIERNDLDAGAINDIILGCVTQVGEQGGNIAKVAALVSNLPSSVSGITINRYCTSGLDAANFAAMKVMTGIDDIVLAGGVESMSRVPMGSDGGAWALDPETNLQLSFVPQGVGADLIATLEDFEREQIDAYALRSQQRAAAARAAGRFATSVVAVKDAVGDTILGEDEFIKPHTTLEGLASLKASFEEMGRMGYDAVALQRYPQVERIRHVHTAGNSSGIVDGAAAVLVGSEAMAKAFDLTPRARVLATALSGADPTIMLTGPMPAARKALAKAGLTIDQIDLFEVNEAFAVVPMRFMKEMGVPEEKVNVNGGAIAMGHPLGATGLAQCYELVSQLRGSADKRQVEGARVALQHNLGLGGAAVVTLYRAD